MIGLIVALTFRDFSFDPWQVFDAESVDAADSVTDNARVTGIPPGWNIAIDFDVYPDETHYGIFKSANFYGE